MKILFCRLNNIAVVFLVLLSLSENVRAADSTGIVGVRLTNESHYVRITGVINGTPAERSQRIYPGMLLLGIITNNGSVYISTRDVSPDKIVELLKGPPDTHIQLELVTMSDDGKPTIERVDIIRMPAGNRDWAVQPFVSQRSTIVTTNTFPLSGEFKTNETSFNSK